MNLSEEWPTFYYGIKSSGKKKMLEIKKDNTRKYTLKKMNLNELRTI